MNRMYPDGRANPTPAHFSTNTPIELHPPVSSRLLEQRKLDREGRAICRIVYAHNTGVQVIARVCCVSEDTVIQAIENKPGHADHDKAEHDLWYVSNEYRMKYTKAVDQPTSDSEDDRLETTTTKANNTGGNQPQKKKQSKTSVPSRGRIHRSFRKSTKIIHPQPTTNTQCPPEPNPNPTCRHFRDNTPVDVVRTAGPNSRFPKLDRKGRAICRIMHPYLGNYTKIAVIFGITHNRVRKAVLNDYSPPDDVSEDYEYAGQEFQDEFPPLSNEPGSKDATRDESPARSQDDSRKRHRSPELDDVSNKRTQKNEVNHWSTTTTAMPVVELSSRSRAQDSGAAAIKSFLKNIGGFDLSKWQEIFKEKGLCNMSDLATLACLEESRLVRTLTRLFAEQKMPEVHILLLADALTDLAAALA
ncbi:hypothetical protein C8R43DRAFT_680855 [Mycena crocata]|nr:hypothetical protein C8R43DRAFT_680855 [Mycena crocata]